MNDDILKNLHTLRSDLRGKLLALRAEERTIRADIEALDRMIERYQGQTALSLNSQASGSNGDKPSTLKGYVIEVLKQNYPHSMKAAQVRDAVIHLGYKSTAKSFDGAMFAMLSNLRKQGAIAKAGTGRYKALESDVIGEIEK